jgi:hypothetical protein
VVSTTVMVWLHTALLLHASVARHVRVALNVFPQKPARLVVVLTTTMVTLVPSHGSVDPGIANTQVEPHSTTASFAQVIVGGVVSTTVMVWLHTALLLHASVARHVRVAVKVLPHWPARLVTVPVIVRVTLVPSHRSLAVGRSKLHGVPHSTVFSPAQLSEGGVVSTTVTVWLQVERLVQASSASQVRVALKVLPQKPARFVTVLIIRTVGAASQLSAALGASKLQAVPHSIVLLPAQVSTGATVSRTVTVRLRVTALEQASSAVQLWLMIQPQPFGAMPEIAVKVTFVPLHRSLAVTTGMAGTSPRHW